jgi:hypothetical protein
MGRMKDKFLEDQQREMDMTDYEYSEYLYKMSKEWALKAPDCGCNPDCGCESVSQMESQANHDAWWDSLTNDQKTQMYIDQEDAFKK